MSSDMETKKESRKEGMQQKLKSLGKLVIEDQATKLLMEEKVDSAGIAVKSFMDFATLSVQPLRIRSLILPGTTTSDGSLEYIKETVSYIPEAQQGEDLAQKTQIEYSAMTSKITIIESIVVGSKAMLEDESLLASYIDGRLICALKEEEERQILSDIILQATNYNADLEKSLGISNRNNIEILRTAMWQVQRTFYPPSGIVLHPLDWFAIMLASDTGGNYLTTNHQGSVLQTLWELPVIISMHMPQGQFLVGAFSLAAQIFDREKSRVVISLDKSKDITIKAEERLALVMYRPQAFVKGTFPDATTKCAKKI